MGIIEIKKDRLKQKLLTRETFTEKEDVMLRMVVKKAYNLVIKNSNKPAIILDDLFWHVGRTCCQKDAPNCVMKRKEPLDLLKERLQLKSSLHCPFMEVCEAARDDHRRLLVEPTFRSIYY